MMLGHMLPGPALQHVVCGAWVNAELTREGSVTNPGIPVGSAHFPDRGIGQLGVRTPFAPGNQFRMRQRRMATLGDHVHGVVSVCSEKQVVGVHAGGHVAPVAHAETIRNGAEEVFPRRPVRQIAPATEPAVPSSPNRPGPQPAAGIGLRAHVGQQDVGEALRLWTHGVDCTCQVRQLDASAGVTLGPGSSWAGTATVIGRWQ